ncbi:MAG: hypothetical protein FJX52_02365 [Alphaproteobacteria bacterium]|nr:hypothetical protein [Alphaproteobacteria bacterium]
MNVVQLSPQELTATWDDFWLLYPRRVAKQDAQKAWSKLTEAERMAALIAVATWRRVWLDRGDLQYVPYAASWLRGARWEDEIPPEYYSSPQPAPLPPVGPRTQMPDSVRELIASLKGRRP